MPSSMNVLRVYAVLLLGFFSMLITTNGRPVILIDLTYTFDNKTPHYPSHTKFETQNRRNLNVGDIEFQTAELFASEHSGTHMDAPYHTNKNYLKLDELPLEIFEGPGVVINITHKANINSNPDATVTVEDIENWEKENGLIAPESFIIMNSGWGKYAFNVTAFTGSNGFNTTYHWPGFGEDACKFLVETRKVRIFGSDTLSADAGISLKFPCHVIISQANGVILENVANVEKLPPSGSYIRAYPMKIGGGSGAPTRIIATITNPTS
ncbi:hypothetical protein CHUAL_005429 [Chamberlinius hualienensis]